MSDQFCSIYELSSNRSWDDARKLFMHSESKDTMAIELVGFLHKWKKIKNQMENIKTKSSSVNRIVKL